MRLSMHNPKIYRRMKRRPLAQTALMEKTARTKIIASEKLRRALACALLFFLFSFLGWCWEKLYFFVVYQMNADRGFLTLPFCTVYGFALILIRLTLGLPRLDEKYPKSLLHFLGYCVAASLIATFVELSTGLFFEQVFGVRLWTYQDFAHSYQDYICLSVSVAWGAMIGIFMAGVWAPLEKRFAAMPAPVLTWGSGLLTLAITLDFFLSAFL